jgi:hypothetical protein
MPGAILLAALIAASTTVDKDGVQTALGEEPADVFLAKATLAQYLSRVARKDWDGARRLTHPKTLAVIRRLRSRVGSERHNLAPWADREQRLQAYRVGGARQVAPGIVAVQVGEDTWHAEERGVSEDDQAVYLLFRSHGGFLVADKKAGAQLADVTDDAVRIGYAGYLDPQLRAQQ